MWSFITCTLHRTLLGDGIDEDEMRRAYSTYGRRWEILKNFGLVNQKGRDHSTELVIDGM